MSVKYLYTCILGVLFKVHHSMYFFVFSVIVSFKINPSCSGHFQKYVEKQLELGLERFPVMYGTVPLPGVVTNSEYSTSIKIYLLNFHLLI